MDATRRFLEYAGHALGLARTYARYDYQIQRALLNYQVGMTR